MAASLNRGAPIKAQCIIILIQGTPKRVPLILGNSYMDHSGIISRESMKLHISYEL